MNPNAKLAWHHIGSYTNGRPTILRYGVMEVARLDERVDGTWFASLYRHLPYEQRPEPRDCTSYTTGRSGCEEWARRHEAEIAEALERWRTESRGRHAFLGNGPVRVTEERRRVMPATSASRSPHDCTGEVN